MGTYHATNAYLNVTLSNANTTGVLRADAMKVVPVFPVWRDSSLGGYEHGEVSPGDSDYIP